MRTRGDGSSPSPVASQWPVQSQSGARWEGCVRHEFVERYLAPSSGASRTGSSRGQQGMREGVVQRRAAETRLPEPWHNVAKHGVPSILVMPNVVLDARWASQGISWVQVSAS